MMLSTLMVTACSASNTKPSFYPNWQSNTLKETKSTTETLIYDVTFDATSFLKQAYFSVEYCGKDNATPGTYTTTLESLDNGTYKYTTDLSVPVTFTMTSDNSVFAEFTDSVHTETIFKQAGSYLQPISSLKQVHCYSARNVAAEKLEDTYTEYHYEFLTTYNDNLTEGTLLRTDKTSDPRTLLSVSKYPDGTAESTFEIDQKKNLYLDNEQLIFALRTLTNKALASSHTFNVYNASMLAMEKVTTSHVADAKTSFEFSVNGGEVASHTIDHTKVTMKINGKNATLSQELWYAQTTNSTVNTYRNVLLQMTTEIHFGIGSLTYKLRSANFSEAISI